MKIVNLQHIQYQKVFGVNVRYKEINYMKNIWKIINFVYYVCFESYCYIRQM